MSKTFSNKKASFIVLLLLFHISIQAKAQHRNHALSSINMSPIQNTINYQSKPKTLAFLKGEKRVINLIVSYKTINFAGKERLAIAVNHQIPGPTLHFKEGDRVTINVYNCLDEPTSIHWHGVLVPWQVDGVTGVSQNAIPPGGVFHYQFQVMQSGTYWYHAHKDVQEQEGLYGAFIIDPPVKLHYHYTKDYVIVLSDWSNFRAENIFANLKKDGDYFSPKFPLQPSLLKFICDYQKASFEERKKLVEDYAMMQKMRMSIYDISDVAYDAFLLNGRSKACPWVAPVKIGDIVRLRFIGAGGSTIFRVKIHDAIMKMVHVQGNDVEPYFTNDFTIAPGETYDVLVKIQKNSPYLIYAESIDTLGAAVGALLTQPNQLIDFSQVPSFPEPPPVTREMMKNMMMEHHLDVSNFKQMHNSSHTMNSTTDQPISNKSNYNQNHAQMSSNTNHSMNMPTEPTIIGDRIIPTSSSRTITIGTKYQNLRAAVKTNDPSKPVNNIIKIELFGYMDRFVWFINGLPEYKAAPILIEPGKRYRIIFTNNSMMRHPMHIHGHWFILRNGQDDYDPLLHTIEVEPGATVVADFDTDASGQWFFHCHHLYHMMAGMARVFQYNTIIQVERECLTPNDLITPQHYVNRPIIRIDEQMPIDSHLINHPMGHYSGFYFANYLDIGEDPFHTVQEITFKGLYGRDYDKIELFTDDAEIKKGSIENADIDIFYWRLISQFWAVKGGINYFYQPAKKPYWQPGIGIEGLMPYFIDTNVRTYFHSGSTKLDVELSRDTQITNNFLIRAAIRSILSTKTVRNAMIGSGLNQMRYILRPYYRLMPGLNLFTEFEHDQDYGVFRNIQHNSGEDTSENTLTFGITWLF